MAQVFPDPVTQANFLSDARQLALLSMQPNLQPSDHFIGLRGSAGSLSRETAGGLIWSSQRLAIYPNAGYSLWLQMAQWTDSDPSFSVSMGFQYEYTNAGSNWRRAIGIGWSESRASIHAQRDIGVFGMLGRTTERYEAGAALNVDLHHAVVEDGHGIPDYDETFLQVVPYIAVMMGAMHSIQLLVPMDKDKVSLVLAYELALGGRSE